MTRRGEDWNVGLAKDLRDGAFAREFLLASIDEGVDLQLALGKVIRAMGVKEFAAKVRMASPNVLRAINPRHNPTQDTLNRLLEPFKLRLSLALLPGETRPNAAQRECASAEAVTMAPLDSLDECIRRAIAEKRLLQIGYKKAIRLAEPHDYGIVEGTERLLIFQLRGPDSGKGAVGWRLLDVVKIESCVITGQTFAGSRGQSHQQHNQWEALFARVA